MVVTEVNTEGNNIEQVGVSYVSPLTIILIITLINFGYFNNAKKIDVGRSKRFYFW